MQSETVQNEQPQVEVTQVGAQPDAPAAPEPEAQEAPEAQEDEATAVDPLDIPHDLSAVVITNTDTDATRLAPTSLDFLKTAFKDDYQIQLGIEGVDEKFVFNFKPVSPELVSLQLETTIPPELEQYTRAVPAGQKPPTIPPQQRKKLAVVRRQQEIEMMQRTLCMAIIEPKLSLNKNDKNALYVGALPDNLFRAAFDAIWNTSVPSTKREWMKLFQPAGNNGVGQA